MSTRRIHTTAELLAMTHLARWLATNGLPGGRVVVETDGGKSFRSLAAPSAGEDNVAYWNRAAAEFEGATEFTCLRIGEEKYTLPLPVLTRAEPTHRYAW